MLPVLFAWLAISPIAAAALPSGHAASVLVLFAEDPTQPSTQALEDGLEDVVARAGPNAPVLYFEYIEATRFEDAPYRAAMRRFMRDKYGDRGIDLLVPIGQSAIEFLADMRNDWWSDVPVLYVATHAMTVDGRALLPDSAGLDFRYDFAQALPPVIALLPDTRHVALISGTSALERARVTGSAAAVRRRDSIRSA